MSAQELFEMTDYCRRTGLAESTCGRRTVNDSKLISRLFELALGDETKASQQLAGGG